VLAPALAIGVAAASCRAPTEIVVDVRTNVAYAPATVTAFVVGAPGETETAEPTAETREPWSLPAGEVGSLVVVPGGAKDGRVSVKIVMGIGREARDCAPGDAAGCIVARRTLRYVPHERLDLPIMLFDVCAGVTCDAESTCNSQGECVGAEIDPGACASGVCDVPGGGSEPPPGEQDAAPQGSDGGSPAIREAAAAEASTGEDASQLAIGQKPRAPPVCPIKGGPKCKPLDMCCAGLSGKYTCATQCLDSETTFACTGGCQAPDVCCLVTNTKSPGATCQSAQACQTIKGSHVVCAEADDCPPGFTCGGELDAFQGMTTCVQVN
jgi:hypothetical protein